MAKLMGFAGSFVTSNFVMLISKIRKKIKVGREMRTVILTMRSISKTRLFPFTKLLRVLELGGF
jgi:hypothetical protein